MERRHGHAERDGQPGIVHTYARGVRASLGNNAAAYAYSVTITAAFGVLTTIVGPTRLWDVFTFAFGAALAFTVTDAVASRGFRVRMRGERPEVAVLGAAMSFPSVLLAVGAAALAGQVALGTPIAWPAGSFAATVVFVLVGAVELLLGERAQQMRGVEDEPE